MRNRSAIPIDSKRALAALCASNTLGMLILYVIPFIIGATTDGFEVSEGTAGITSSWELGVMAAVSMLLAARYQGIDKRRWSAVGALAFIGGYWLSFWSLQTGQWYGFLIARGITGAGEGILLGVSSGLAAQTTRPDRTFAWFSGIHIATSILCFWALPIAMEWLGPAGVLFTMAGAGMLAAPLIGWTPDPSTARTRDSLDSSNAPTPNSQPAREHRGSTTVLLLLSVGSLNLGMNTIFPFTERIGLSIGFTAPEIGRILAVGAAISIIGPIAAGVLATRGGRTLSLGLGAATQVAASFLFVYCSSHLLWASTYVISTTTLDYFIPLLYGLVAYYDRTGRMNAAAASVTAWMAAAGPLLSGLVLNAGGGYRSIGWLTAVSYALIFVFAYRPSRAAESGLRQRSDTT